MKVGRAATEVEVEDEDSEELSSAAQAPLARAAAAQAMVAWLNFIVNVYYRVKTATTESITKSAKKQEAVC